MPSEDTFVFVMMLYRHILFTDEVLVKPGFSNKKKKGKINLYYILAQF
jgi:hypothetical protein